MVFFVDGVPWFLDRATGQHWRDTSLDSVMLEAGSEDEVLEEIAATETAGAEGGETETLEAEADVLAAAQVLINAGVR